MTHAKHDVNVDAADERHKYEKWRSDWLWGVLKSRELAASAKAIAAVMYLRLKPWDKMVWPGRRQLAVDAGIAKGSAETAIKELTSLGFVTTEKRWVSPKRRRSNRYTTNPPFHP
ncbi:MAG TPA: hypothetical protein VLA17_13470 [Candidatus Limnocylindria bacterium]|nr:hypothetical protein [Candidatus Limnocylindria bacterium]